MRGASLIVAALFVSACSTAHSTAIVQSPASTPSPAASPSPVESPSLVARQALPPARSLPIVALCTQSLTVAQDGNAGPLLCANGSLNVSAWKFFAPLSPNLLSAGPGVSEQAVESALCADVRAHATYPQERSAYELAAAYYGWSFTPDPTSVIYSGCP